MPEKEIIGASANVAVGGCFAFTLASIDTFISIALGAVGLIVGVYSILWHRLRIKNAKAAEREVSDEQSDR